MQDLKDFYQNIVCQIWPSDRYSAILEIHDVIVVNFDCLYDRECSIRGLDQLIYLLHQKGKNKRFIFISEDGANITNSAALRVIENIRDCFLLNEQTCAVVCREDINIDDVLVINYPSIPYWCNTLYQHIKTINIPAGPFTKKFAVWFNRGTYYRLDIARHLYDHYRDVSYISYQEQGMIADRKLSEYFPNKQWAEKNTPIVYDELFPNRVFDFDLIVGENRKPYNDYFMEIVAETDILSNSWITEKTVKNLYIGKPFILMSGVNSLRTIHSYGFKTFSQWIDESYDRENNIHTRLEMIKEEINRIARLSLEELNQIHQQMIPIFEHNRAVYEDITRR